MKKILMLTLAVLLPSSFVAADNDHLKPDGLISQEEAVEFRDAFLQSQKESAVAKHHSNMPTEFTFELERLKQYIAYVEAEAERLGHSDLALRVYLAAYPTGYKDNYTAEPTVFFAPANRDTGGNAQDKYDTIYAIEPLNHGGGGTGGYPVDD